LDAPNGYPQLIGRRVEDLATRFERLVDRTGEHHLWLGSINPERGTGRIKVGNAAMTAHRVAWELAHGPVGPTERVLTCSSNPACVRVNHLRVESSEQANQKRVQRARKGSGSMRLVRPGKWELRLSLGRWENGRPRSFTRTISARGKIAAATALAEFVEEMSEASFP
jgi:hypothetical protein